MNIKKKYIGAKVYHPILNQHILIELGNEEKYEKLGLDIFTKRNQPILKKNKPNDKTTKKRSNNVRDNSNGTDDNNKSGVSV